MFMYIHVRAQGTSTFTIHNTWIPIQDPYRYAYMDLISNSTIPLCHDLLTHPLQMTLPSHHHLLFGHLSDTTSKQLYNDFVLQHAV